MRKLARSTAALAALACTAWDWPWQGKPSTYDLYTHAMLPIIQLKMTEFYKSAQSDCSINCNYLGQQESHWPNEKERHEARNSSIRPDVGQSLIERFRVEDMDYRFVTTIRSVQEIAIVDGAAVIDGVRLSEGTIRRATLEYSRSLSVSRNGQYPGRSEHVSVKNTVYPLLNVEDEKCEKYRLPQSNGFASQEQIFRLAGGAECKVSAAWLDGKWRYTATITTRTVQTAEAKTRE